MTDIYIISGFLGAGKTTLIQTMVRTVFRDRKVVVIENDFGEAEIDASLLRECRLTVTSMNAGCICCSMTGDFEKAIARIVKEYEPDAILVEPSGVGKLSDIIKSCLRQKDLVRLNRCITVVDEMKFDKYKENYGEFFQDQIRYADLILLSHQRDHADEIEQTIGKIRDMNQEAQILADFWDSIPVSVFQSGQRVNGVRTLETVTSAGPKYNRMIRFGGRGEKKGYPRLHFAREIFTTVTLDCGGSLSKDQLRQKITRVLKHTDGLILRGKGIVRSGDGGLLFQYIPGILKIEPCTAEGSSVCFIGTGLSEQQIKTLFEGEL
ncbi:CobW family GTP-binding protein [Clostridium sp. Marseille-P2415]|uniref:CobW family GTP-binding protein n=1 Tax=Clostridium sp. Marseille-P2415 TaxID=1805471 RepID=UPI0009885FA6|nr:CobW family GTP-binding protein [Clostridium sp. Marseille-P2415]